MWKQTVNLVDAGFGGNGFYLPFDPAQTGAIYSNGVVTGQTDNAQGLGAGFGLGKTPLMEAWALLSEQRTSLVVLLN